MTMSRGNNPRPAPDCLPFRQAEEHIDGVEPQFCLFGCVIRLG